MGASVWSWRVAYRPDLGEALQQARQEAYDQERFYRQPPDDRARSMNEEEYVAWGLARLRQDTADVFGEDDWEPDDSFARESWRAARVDVTGPDSLVLSQPFSGTHSIIDMTGVAAEPAPEMVAPVPAAELEALFGTDRPRAAEMAEAIENGTLGGLERWFGRYAIAYAGDEPDAIFFFGYSGD